MANRNAFITWQPLLTDHQAFTYQALSDLAHIPVIAYVASMEDAVRKAQGWSDTKVTSIERRLIPNKGFLSYCFRELHQYRAEAHIFASPFQQPRLMLCILIAMCLGIEFYLISEPYSTNKEGYLANTSRFLGAIKAKFRPIFYRFYVLLLRRKVAGIFAISKLAVLQYQKAGISKYKIFPFGYFIPTEVVARTAYNPHKLIAENSLNIIFIGSLIRIKGVDLLQEAVQILLARGCHVNFDIYGSGDASLIPGNDSHMHYKGLIPFGHSQSFIATYDLLVLPSRYDGWGVVVNEALCAGVPVVCSDTVGSGYVAMAFGAGLIFRSGDAASLSDVLAELAANPSKLMALRSAAPLAAAALQPLIAARFMLDVIESPLHLRSKVQAPWIP